MTQPLPAAFGSPSVIGETRALGQVFTPGAIVDFVLDQAGLASLKLGETPIILEPACGDGAFLIAAARQLIEANAPERAGLSKKANAVRVAELLRRCLWGIDIDPVAVTDARVAVAKYFREVTGCDVPTTLVESNIVCADFLLDDVVRKLPPLQSQACDYVLGNPPYVAATALSSAHKDLLRSSFETATGRIDLYGMFIERGVQVLGIGGKLAFIVPDKLLQSQTAAPLRSLLLRSGAVISIARFDSHKVFDNAATVPCVVVFERDSPPKQFQSLECEYLSSSAVPSIVVRRSEQLPSTRLDRSAWKVGSGSEEALADVIMAGHPSLGKFSRRISAGLATGRDSIFVLRNEVAGEVESELLRSAVRGRDLGALSAAASGLSILLPYKFDQGAATLIDIKKYPKAARYLRRFRDELIKRHCVKTWEKSWYDIHDPVTEDLAQLPKVLVPDIAEAPRFVFDEGNLCPLHSAYYIVPAGVDGRFLAALLNSEPIEFLVRLRAPIVKDGFNRYRRQFLIDLPIPHADEAIQERMISAADERDFESINDIAARLFQLSTAQLRAIESYLKPLRYRRALKERTRDTAARA